MCLCKCVCIKRSSEEVIRSPGAGVIDRCESPDMGSGSWTLDLWKSRKCSYLLSHLLSPWFDFLKVVNNLPHEPNVLFLYHPHEANTLIFSKVCILVTFFVWNHLQLLESQLTASSSQGCDPDLGTCLVSVVCSFLDLSLGGIPPRIQCSFLQAEFCSVFGTHFIIVLLSLDGSRRKILE